MRLIIKAKNNFFYSLLITGQASDLIHHNNILQSPVFLLNSRYPYSVTQNIRVKKLLTNDERDLIFLSIGFGKHDIERGAYRHDIGDENTR